MNADIIEIQTNTHILRVGQMVQYKKDTHLKGKITHFHAMAAFGGGVDILLHVEDLMMYKLSPFPKDWEPVTGEEK